jgi:hypothetical protein
VVAATSRHGGAGASLPPRGAHELCGGGAARGGHRKRAPRGGRHGGEQGPAGLRARAPVAVAASGRRSVQGERCGRRRRPRAGGGGGRVAHAGRSGRRFRLLSGGPSAISMMRGSLARGHSVAQTTRSMLPSLPCVARRRRMRRCPSLCRLCLSPCDPFPGTWPGAGMCGRRRPQGIQVRTRRRDTASAQHGRSVHGELSSACLRARRLRCRLGP